MAGETAIAATEPNLEIVDLATAEIKIAADEGSMANLLEASQEARLIGDDGPPPNELEDESEAPEETPEEKAAREKADAEAAAAIEAAKLKFATVEEYDKAYKEAETRMHTATTETATERKAREAAEERERQLIQERDELKQKLEEVAKPPEEKPTETPKPVTREEKKARIAQALKTIRSLDPDDAGYDDKVAGAWADAGVGGPDTPLPSQEEITKAVAKQVRDDLKAEQAAAVMAKVEEEKATAAEKAWQEAVGIGQKAGLNLDDQDSADYIIFERMTGKIPEEMKGKTVAEIADWMVVETRKRTGQVVQTQAQREAAARKVQTENAVLGRGNERPAAVTRKKEEEAPFTMGGLMEQNLRSRRL